MSCFPQPSHGAHAGKRLLTCSPPQSRGTYFVVFTASVPAREANLSSAGSLMNLAVSLGRWWQPEQSYKKMVK